MPRTKSQETLGPTMPVRFHAATEKEISTASKKTGLSRADVVRQATKMGLPRLLEALVGVADERKAA